MSHRKPVNITYNQETKLALLEMSVLNIANTLNEMRKDSKDEFKLLKEEINSSRKELKEEIREFKEEFKNEIREVKSNAQSNFKWLLGIMFSTQITVISAVFAALGKAYNWF